MIQVRVIDNEGKDEIHTVLKATAVGDKLWFYTKGRQYYLPTDTIEFLQMWGYTPIDFKEALGDDNDGAK